MIFSTGFKLIYVNHRNTAILARWLDAKYYVSKYRPVPIENVAYSAFTSNHLLTEASHLALEASSQILRKPRPLRNIQPSQYSELRNPVINSVVALASEIANAGFGALIFCSSRIRCEGDAALVSQVLSDGRQVAEEVLQRRQDLISEPRSTSTGLDHILERAIPQGVAFHPSSSSSHNITNLQPPKSY
jgi:replicative superfamily II helicase